MDHDKLDQLVLEVLRAYGRGPDGLRRFASTVRVMRDLKIKIQSADPDEEGPFALVAESLDRLAERCLVQKREVMGDTFKWRAISVLDLMAQAVHEGSDE